MTNFKNVKVQCFRCISRSAILEFLENVEASTFSYDCAISYNIQIIDCWFRRFIYYSRDPTDFESVNFKASRGVIQCVSVIQTSHIWVHFVVAILKNGAVKSWSPEPDIALTKNEMFRLVFHVLGTVRRLNKGKNVMHRMRIPLHAGSQLLSTNCQY